MDELFAWATALGAEVSAFRLGTNDSSTGLRGGVATKDLPEGSVIGYLPDSIILSESVAKRSAIGQAIIQTLDSQPDRLAALSSRSGTDPHIRGLIILAAFIARERFYLGRTSFWAPYLDTLVRA